MNKKLFSNILKIFLSLLFLLIAVSAVSFIVSKKSQTKAEAPSSERLILGFSQIGSESAWRTRNTQSIFEAAEENNIQILYDDAQQKQENQLKAIRSFIVYQVDVIAFVPIVEDGWDNVLQEAKEANIPIIIVDRQINADPSLYAGFLGEDGYIEGQNAGNFLVKKCLKSDKDINVLELTGTNNSSVATERGTGFRDVISKYPQIKIIHSEDGDFLRSRGKEIMNRIIEENHDLKINNQPIDVIFSHNDSMTLGLLDVLDQKNIDYSNTVIISIDAEQKSIDAMMAGKLNCVVECNPNQGPILMQLVQDIAKGKTIPRTTYMKETVFTEDDDFTLYTPRGY